MAVTRANVYTGLAGMLLLRDEFDTGVQGNPLGLPAGEFEMPLILQVPRGMPQRHPVLGSLVR